MQEFGLTQDNVEGSVHVFNACIDSLAHAIRKCRIDPLQSEVACWENCSAIHKAEEVCQLICDVIAPNDGKQLFQAVVNQQKNKGDTGSVALQALLLAYQKCTL